MAYDEIDDAHHDWIECWIYVTPQELKKMYTYINISVLTIECSHFFSLHECLYMNLIFYNQLIEYIILRTDGTAK